MKKGKMIGKDNNVFRFVFMLLLLVALIVVGYFSGFFGKITTLDVKNVGLNITVGTSQIIEVQNGTGPLTLSSSLLVGKSINFTVYNGVSTSVLNDSTVLLNVTFYNQPNEVPRNATCERLNSSTNYATYNCTVQMAWYDGAGNWNISIVIKDNNSNPAYNYSTTFGVSALTGFDIGPVNLTWNPFSPGSTNQTANNDPFNLTNIGNQPFGNTSGNISINSTNLVGETNVNLALYARNFTISTVTGGSCSGAACTECDNASGSHLTLALHKNISKAVLSKGNYTVGDGVTGQEQLYFCLRTSGFDLTTQSYSTKTNGTWTVQIYN